MSLVHRRGGRVDICRVVVVVELRPLGNLQTTHLFVIVGVEKGGTTCPTYEHHNEQNIKSANDNSSVGGNLAPTYFRLSLLGVVV